jgi:two-component system phosphate regulon response regulator PhoB
MALTNERIAVIEDEPDISEIITYNLEREGYRVSTYDTGRAGLAGVSKERPDAIILDLMLPGVDGLEICQELRSNNDTRTLPIIMVTAKGEESDIVLGLGLGADDYVVKPFKPRELVARLKAVLRRTKRAASTEESDRLEFEGVVIDSAAHEVYIDDERSQFTATEFRLLHFLARHPGRVFTRAQLVDQVIGDGAIVIDRNIDVHVRSVRKHLGPYRHLIETVRSVGYRFHQDV